MEFLSLLLTFQPIAIINVREPVVLFAILLTVILVIPIIFERLKLPGLVGLVLTGVILGPSGFNLFDAQLETMRMLSNIGLVYLIFIAGLEVDTNIFRRYPHRCLGFGCLSFNIPLLAGTFLARFIGMDWDEAILLGSLLSSYSLIAYPIVNRLGVVKNEAVIISIGANVFNKIGALLILVVCLAIRNQGLNIFQVITLLGWLTIYGTLIIAGFDWAGREFFRRCGNDEGNQFLFMLLAVFIAAVGAQLLQVEKIFGAFLAGLAVNELLGKGAVKEKLAFAGSVLFIPIFFIYVGLLIKLPNLIENIGLLKLTLIFTAGTIVSKLIAVFLIKLFYRYNRKEALTILSILIPQLSIALAISVVSYQMQLFEQNTFNSLILLILITSTFGPILTKRVAVGLKTVATTQINTTTLSYSRQGTADNKFNIVVPIYNPQTQQYLIEMASLLAKQNSGKIIPLAIATASTHMDTPQLESSLQRSERSLFKAVRLSRLLEVEVEPLLRIDDAFAQGISRAAREQKANLIVMGWGKRTGLKARLFGSVIDSVVRSSHCPVAVSRLGESPTKIQRILVPIENLAAPTLQPIEFAHILAEANQGIVTVLNVCDRRTSSSKIAWRRSQIALIVSQLGLVNPPEIQIIAHENTTQAILQASRLYDLVVLPFIHNRTIPGGLSITDVTDSLARQLTCSLIMLGEPQRNDAPILSPDRTGATAFAS
ncbi:MAG: cation:proton antiporter [Cyanobacteria bacterium P01_A01_bin.84]